VAQFTVLAAWLKLSAWQPALGMAFPGASRESFPGDYH